ncbi:hypothetical protein Taro_028129 [Colocasia esculenta]|uniref:Uncharacterized protein n=1 Tax=Colocasia esculenta TaxID=4460 RepID=A0A843VPI0_COLES|nr:hypothetical protein [Colocasia esculenta]
MYQEKQIPTKGTYTYYHEVPPQSLRTTVLTTEHTTNQPVSNPDNITQELPLSLVAMDPQSNYGSTNLQVKQLTVETNKHHHLQVTHPAGPCLAPLGTLA